MKHFLLLYEYVADFKDKRAPLRAPHLALAKAAAARGELELGGALTEEPLGVLLFRAQTSAVAEDFARADPYVTGNYAAAPIVTSWRVREWMTVVGAGAANPV